MANRNKRVDWDRVKRLYRAGMLSIYEIGRECSVPEQNIRYHAKKNGWTRDLTDEVRRAARTKMVENIAKSMDGGKVAAEKAGKITEDEIVELAARTQVEVVRQHQRTLGAGHTLTMRMLNELDTMTTQQGELMEMIKSVEDPKRQHALFRATSLGNRATTMRDLATAARLWVTLERQAFNISDDRDKDDSAQRKLDSMTAEQLRKEILEDARKLGLELTSEELSKPKGVIPSRIQPGNGKMH
jgi:hypothetical protein